MLLLFYSGIIILTNQLIRSGTSVGANIREAFYGNGTADFIAKLQIALIDKLKKNIEIENDNGD